MTIKMQSKKVKLVCHILERIKHQEFATIDVEVKNDLDEDVDSEEEEVAVNHQLGGRRMRDLLVEHGGWKKVVIPHSCS